MTCRDNRPSPLPANCQVCRHAPYMLGCGPKVDEDNVLHEACSINSKSWSRSSLKALCGVHLPCNMARKHYECTRHRRCWPYWIFDLRQALVSWIVLSILLYLLTDAFWLPVVWMQLEMRNLAVAAVSTGDALPPRDCVLFRLWVSSVSLRSQQSSLYSG